MKNEKEILNEIERLEKDLTSKKMQRINCDVNEYLEINELAREIELIQREINLLSWVLGKNYGRIISFENGVQTITDLR